MAYRDDLEAARDRISQLERELAESRGRLAAAEAREQSADQASKRERQQRRRSLEAHQRAQQRGQSARRDRADSASWLGRAASRAGFLLSLTPVLIGSGVVLLFWLGLTTVMAEAGLAPQPSSELYLAALLGLPALALLGFTVSVAVVGLAARRERRWARALPFQLPDYHLLYDGHMATGGRLRCRATTTSIARTATIIDDASALADGLAAEVEVSWHDGHLELAVPLPPTSSAWRAARQAHATVHALVDRILVPLHASHPLEHVTLQTRP